MGLGDVIGIAQYGVVYTGHPSKIAEHAGDHPEDRNVPILVAWPGATSDGAVETTQIAPTILELLGLRPEELQAVQIEARSPSSRPLLDRLEPTKSPRPRRSAPAQSGLEEVRSGRRNRSIGPPSNYAILPWILGGFGEFAEHERLAIIGAFLQPNQRTTVRLVVASFVLVSLASLARGAAFNSGFGPCRFSHPY